MKLKIFVVDDHPLLRHGITQLINGEEDMEVCGEADNATDAIESIAKTAPHLAILDISLNGTNGIELLKQLKTLFPDLKLLMLSMHDESVVVERALLAGASGYITKDEATNEALAAIRCVRAGEIFLSKAVAARLCHRSWEDRAWSDCDSTGGQASLFKTESEGYILYAPLKRSIRLREKTMEGVK